MLSMSAGVVVQGRKADHSLIRRPPRCRAGPFACSPSPKPSDWGEKQRAGGDAWPQIATDNPSQCRLYSLWGNWLSRERATTSVTNFRLGDIHLEVYLRLPRTFLAPGLKKIAKLA